MNDNGFPKKECKTCRKIKQLSEFYRNKNLYDGRHKSCRVCEYTPTPRKYVKPWNKGLKGFGGIGKNNIHFKGGRSTTKTGYIRVLIEGTASYELEHRRIARQIIGRELDRYEAVHHRDGNKTNNSIDNLQIITLSQHARLHFNQREKDSLGRLL